MTEVNKFVMMVFWFYIVFPFSGGWALMLLAGVLHSMVGFPLLSYWLAVGIMALISWLIGSFQLRVEMGKRFNDEYLN